MFEVDRYKVVFQNAENVPFEIPSSTDDNPRLVERDGLYAHILEDTGQKTVSDNKTVWQQLYSGFAAAHPDQGIRGSRNVGRKVALARALKVSNFGRDERKMFWDAYARARGGKLEG